MLPVNYVIRNFFRCHGMTISAANIGASGLFNSKQASSGPNTKGWDHRWLKHCPCGGFWKIETLNNP